MAPKATIAQLKQLLGKLERDQAGAGRAKPGAKAAGNWDCPHCTTGANNFAYRTCCFKCGADRRTGILQLSVAQQQTGQQHASRATASRARGGPGSQARPRPRRRVYISGIYPVHSVTLAAYTLQRACTRAALAALNISYNSAS